MLTKNAHKKENGQFFTITNPFFVSIFYKWFELIPKDDRQVILEPFAGSNNIVKLVNELSVGGKEEKKFKCFDIDISHENQYPECQIEQRDTIANYPTGYHVAITNPPYLARNSATRNGLNYPDTIYDDLYKLCLDVMLSNTEYVAAIIPESFITSELFLDRLYAAVSLTCKMFDDTDCPVCLALFVPNDVKISIYKDPSDFVLYRMDKKIGLRTAIKKKENNITKHKEKITWVFNDKEGVVGIQCIDNTKRPTIRFVMGETIDQSKIKVSSRSLTRVSGLPEDIDVNEFIDMCNVVLGEYRTATSDICLTSFKGLRDDTMYRRRLDFKTAKLIMNAAIYRIRRIHNGKQ